MKKGEYVCEYTGCGVAVPMPYIVTSVGAYGTRTSFLYCCYEHALAGLRWEAATRGEDVRYVNEAGEARIVPASEVIDCPASRMDSEHFIPRHKTEECGGE